MMLTIPKYSVMYCLTVVFQFQGKNPMDRMELQHKNAEEDSPNRTVGIWVWIYFKENENMIA